MASKFLEFLKQKDKIKTSLVPDYDGPQHDTPPGGGAPYKAKSAGKSGGKDKGFADLGDQPEYKPGQAKAAKKAEQVKESNNFVDKTKNMDREKFLNYMRKNSKNTFEVYETAARVASTIRQNPNAAEAIIREAKRNGTLPRLVKEMAKHKEFFEAFAYVMGSKQMGDQVCRRLAKAMNEVVGPPAPPMGMGHDKPSAFGGLKKPSAPPLDDDEDDMSDDSEDSEMDDMGDDEMGDGSDDMGMGDDEDSLGGGADDLDLDLDFGDDDGGLGDSPNSGMDDMGLNDEPAVGDDEDDMSDDDDDSEDDSDDDSGNPFGKKPAGLPAPRPSMMARMMRKESYTPAQRKFFREMRGW